MIRAREKTDPQTCKPYKHEYRSSRSRNSSVLFLEQRSGHGQNFTSAPTLIVRDNWCEMPSFPIPVTCLYYLWCNAQYMRKFEHVMSRYVQRNVYRNCRILSYRERKLAHLLTLIGVPGITSPIASLFQKCIRLCLIRESSRNSLQ